MGQLHKNMQNGTQRYYCNLCKKSYQAQYHYKAYNTTTNKFIYLLITNSCGISDISRILKISRNTVKRRLFQLSNYIKTPIFNDYNQSYEIDEMYVKIKGMGKNCWITYAINKTTKRVIEFNIGKRRAKDLAPVVNKVLMFNPKKNLYRPLEII